MLTLVLFLAVCHVTSAVPTDKKQKEVKPQTLHSIVVHVEEAYDPYKDQQFDLAGDLFMTRDKLPDPYVIVKYRAYLPDGSLSAAPLFLGKTKIHNSVDLVKFDEVIAYYGQDNRRPTTNGVLDLEVWDRDGLGLRDDFIGFCRVDLRDPNQYTGSGTLARYRTPLIGAGYDTKEFGMGFISFRVNAQVANSDYKN